MKTLKTFKQFLNERSAPNYKQELFKSIKLIGFIRDGDIDKVQEELEKGADVNMSFSAWTPLHYASRQPNTDIVQLLLQYQPNLEAKTNIGDTPLHLACKNTNNEVILELVKSGADVEARNNMNELPIYLYKKYIEAKESPLNDKVIRALS